jgi:hypothetical protein
MNNLHPPIFLTMGHGEDDININYNERKKLPKGYTLITLAQCGVVTQRENVVPFMEAFMDKEKEELLSHPNENKEILNKIGNTEVHIYNEGMSYPSLYLHLFIDFGDVGDDKKVDITKSGIYKFPVARENLEISPDAEGEEKYFGKLSVDSSFMPKISNLEELKNMYKGSLFPTTDEIEEIYRITKSLSKIKKNTIHSLDDIFEKFGPGIYYFVVCRAPKATTLSSYLNLYMLNENIPNGFKESSNTSSFIPALLPHMLKLKAQEEERLKSDKKKWNTNNLLEAPNKYRKMYERIQTTRAKSAERQRPKVKGGKRKTHRNKNKMKRNKTCRK